MPHLTKEEIIRETIKHYAHNPRSIGEIDGITHCVYIAPGGARCAFSRCCIPNKKNNAILKSFEESSCNPILDIHGDTILKPQYRGHERHFWWALQQLHDTPAYWKKKPNGGNTLSKMGRMYIEINFDISLP